jgi:gamma-glutamyltranspeptidase
LTTFSGTVDFLHRFIEASKFAYSVRNSLGDIAYVPTAMELAKKLTSKEWAESVRWVGNLPFYINIDSSTL